jgi:Zn-dependent protease with chaperone function
MPLQEQSPAAKRAVSGALFRLAILKCLTNLLFLMAWLVLAEQLWFQYVGALARTEQVLAYFASLVIAGVVYLTLFGLWAVRRGTLTARLTGRAPKAQIVDAIKTEAFRPLGALAVLAVWTLLVWVWKIPLAVLVVWLIWLWFSTPREMRKFTSSPPLDDVLRDKVTHLEHLAERLGIGNIPIKVIDPFPWPLTLAACGAVKKRQDWIFLSRTSLDLLDDREMMAILAHEAAHSRLGHTRPQTTLGVAYGVGIAILAVLSADMSPAVWFFLPGPPMLFLALSLVNLLIHPVQAAIDRRTERAANRLALERTADPAAFISALTKLARHMGADRPLCGWERMIATAPSLEEMTNQARRFARDKGILLEEPGNG